MANINRKGRTFTPGKSLSIDFRQLVLDEMLLLGAPEGVAKFKGLYTKAKMVSDKLKISKTVVVKLWQQMCEDGTVDPEFTNKRKSGRTSKLSDDDLAYIEQLKVENPSITYAEITRKLEEMGSIPDGIARSSLSYAVRNKLSVPFTWKRSTTANSRRFTNENIIYTQNYIDVILTLNPHTVKFMDESGFQFPETCNPKYGHSAKGTRCVQICRYAPRPNVTLNLLLGTSGVLYANTVNGASTGMDYMNFFTEAMSATKPDGDPVLMAGDTIVIDNCPTHHCDHANALYDWLAEHGVDVLFTPKYSPEMNPCEFAFNKMKTLVKRPYFRDLLYRNIAYGIYEVLEHISANDAYGFYNKAGCLLE